MELLSRANEVYVWFIDLSKQSPVLAGVTQALNGINNEIPLSI